MSRIADTSTEGYPSTSRSVITIRCRPGSRASAAETCDLISPASVCCSGDGHVAGKSRQWPAYGSAGPRVDGRAVVLVGGVQAAPRDAAVLPRASTPGDVHQDPVHPRPERGPSLVPGDPFDDREPRLLDHFGGGVVGRHERSSQPDHLARPGIDQPRERGLVPGPQPGGQFVVGRQRLHSRRSEPRLLRGRACGLCPSAGWTSVGSPLVARGLASHWSGRMFWLRWKTLSGSYRRLSAASRVSLPPGYARRTPLSPSSASTLT
jgi:hypothetical protein